MRLLLAEMDCEWEDKLNNHERCQRFTREAKKLGGELILFPEMTLTGFSMNIDKTGEYIIDNQSETIEFFQKLSQKEEIGIGYGIVENIGEYGGQKAWNEYCIVDKYGVLQTRYKKIHPFTYGREGESFIGGDELCFTTIGDIRITIFICYDLRFPELFQIASKMSDLIIVPANWPTERQSQYTSLLKARAIETQCYVAGVNRVGTGDGLTYTGGSIVYDPYGNEISKKLDMGSGETLLLADLNEMIVANYREKFPVKDDRQEQLYRKYYTK